MAFKEEDLLQLSGLQHFAFCRRQWALIHIENQWADDMRTVDGTIMHEKVHDGTSFESRGDLKITRGMYVRSQELGITGQCDVVEFHESVDGIPMHGWEGRWLPFPVEYKRGSARSSDGDRLQLCAQAMCLEEMLCCPVPRGALFYGETRRREMVECGEELRTQVRQCLEQMHELYKRGHTPKVKRTRSCSACSLNPICTPSLMRNTDVRKYLLDSLEVSG